MEELGQEMLKHCAGLPLAIIALSGLLSTKQTMDEWELLLKDVKPYINRGAGYDGQQSEGVSSILSLSFDELHYNLKPCFLNLAHFPEDHVLMVKQLCRVWIAEGFVSLDQQTQSSTVTAEDLAYNYLRELVDRNMVQVGIIGSSGRIKTCRLHDLMRDLSFSKAQEANFVQFVDFRIRDRLSTNVGLRNKVRRLALYTDHRFTDLLPLINQGEGSLLRVLKLESAPFGASGKLPKEIGMLIHLRFLCLRNLLVEKIPSSIGNLRCLETLDLRVTLDDNEVPNVFWRLEQLRHLYLPSAYHVSGEHLRLTNLSNLQTLFDVPIKYLDVNDLLRLTNLKKLVLTVDEDLGRIYGTNMTFNGLRSLSLCGGFGQATVVDILPTISRYPQLSKLQMSIPITKLPKHHQFSTNLVKFWLIDTRLKDDPLRTLEKLPNLRNLFLWHLKEWRTEEGALLSLRHGCVKLSELPDGLRFVTSLKEFEIR
ncbi:hypothetical protein TIFTF001_043072 [Ficus carica]|uniref:NB-ARC domain-containing protein n=1 Tax=Ficus carica TaxID=3494 RepID=A0AA88CWK9_FICCA|nr:hypothetical protein TIFTF001_043072 [Ficus carica]